MFETIDGRKVNGKVINRYQKTMSVLLEDGGTVTCKLQGDPQEKVNNFNKWPKTSKKIDLKNVRSSGKYGKNKIAIRVVFNDGKFEDYLSIRSCSSAIGLDKSEIARLIESGNVVRNGPLKGSTFHRMTLED